MTASRTLLPAAVLAPFVFVLAAGCSDKTNPTSRVALFSLLGSTAAHDNTVCQLGPQTDWLDIGQLGPNRAPGDPTVPVNDGDGWPSGGPAVHISACSVTVDGDGFQVNVSVTQDGKGSFTVNGHVTAQGPVTPVQAIFNRGDTGTFRQDDCTVTYPRPEMGVKAGAVWGQIDCPNVANTGQNRTCGANAEFRFENCSQ